MPELPEVEAVRAGLERHLPGRTIRAVEIVDPRPLRRQVGGPDAFSAALTGRTIGAAVRRGKRLWLPLDDGRALSAHLGMSGQLLLRRMAGPPVGRAPSLVRELSTSAKHLRVRINLEAAPGEAPGEAPGAAPGDPPPAFPGEAPGGPALELVDQRMFGGLHVTVLVPTADGAPGGRGSAAPLVPEDAVGLARDLLDPAADLAAAAQRMHRSRRAVKTLLLDQGIVSGVGNIYADEGLWAARVHGASPGTHLAPGDIVGLLGQTAAVMERALALGGTSFDSLYVDAQGRPGSFADELAVYGRVGQPCARCGTTLDSQVLGGRRHTFCPACQVPSA